MKTQAKVALTHLGTAAGGFIAAIGFMSQHSVDLYAVWDQFNVVVAQATKLVAMITPIATGAYAVYMASTKNQLATIAQDPAVKAVITTDTVAAQVPSEKVVASVNDLPQNALG